MDTIWVFWIGKEIFFLMPIIKWIGVKWYMSTIWTLNKNKLVDELPAHKLSLTDIQLILGAILI